MTERLADRINELEGALTELRRQTTRQRRWLVGTVLTGAAGLAMAAAPAARDILQAQRVEIVDADGNLVLALAADDAGGRLDVWTKDGANVLRAASNARGGDLNLWGASGTTLFSAFAGETGGEVGLWDTDGRRSLRAASSGGAGRLELSGAGVGQVTLGASPTGGRLQLDTPEGTPIIDAGARPDRPGFAAYNAGGRAIFAVEPDALVGATVTVADGAGDARITMGSDTRGGSLSFLNERGQTALAAGVADPIGHGFVDLRNADGTRVFTATSNPDGCGRLDLAERGGQTVFTVDGQAGIGAVMAMYEASGKKGLLVGSRPQGGLLNLFNQREVPVIVAGYADQGLGGAMSVKNSRGLPVVHATTNAEDDGEVSVYDASNSRVRTVKVLR
ncbi:MAG: hypothetical protein HKO59_09890 [Phycisphaerales bacterium]|nr:hypothetical protein [Phycisphaerae bacterium]NNF44386.1 hypothetical protein [Phycisphaerales bacterium]NNM26274.1 hypothetical protein [Phycisphaerales bacterium]